jgi:hypothetical protein
MMKTGTVGFRSSAFHVEEDEDEEQDKDEEGRVLGLDTMGLT